MLKQLKLIYPVPFYNAVRMNSTRKYSLHSESSAESTPLENRQKKLYVKTVELQAHCIGFHWIRFIVSKTNPMKQMKLIF